MAAQPTYRGAVPFNLRALTRHAGPAGRLKATNRSRGTALVNPDLGRPHIPLDFRRRQSVHAGVERRAEDRMSEGQETGISITGCLCEIRDRLTDAAAVAKAAVTCAESGSEHEAVRIVLDVEEMLHEASTLLNGVPSQPTRISTVLLCVSR